MIKYIVPALLLLATPVAAQQGCFPARDVIGTLVNEFQEIPIFQGHVNGEPQAWVFANPTRTTWTVVFAASMPGYLCMMASGDAWTLPKSNDVQK